MTRSVSAGYSTHLKQRRTVAANYDEAYVNHFVNMLAQSSPHISLEAMPLTTPGTFLFVDDTYLSWEVCEVATRAGDAVQTWTSSYTVEFDGMTPAAIAAFKSALLPSQTRKLSSLTSDEEQGAAV